MELNFDFYSKTALAVRILYEGRYPFPDNEMSDLFLFSCFSLRQFYNLGLHPVPYALAGWMASSSSLSALLESEEQPTGSQLVRAADTHIILTLSNVTEPFSNSFTTAKQKLILNVNPSLIDVLDNQFLSELPKLVSFQGQGAKRFKLTLPPLNLQSNGFGFLGMMVNYYAFHSVIGLTRFLAQKYRFEQLFLERLKAVALMCASQYLFKSISMDQVPQANQIVKAVMDSQ